jgi:hypothetical protein
MSDSRLLPVTRKVTAADLAKAMASFQEQVHAAFIEGSDETADAEPYIADALRWGEPQAVADVFFAAVSLVGGSYAAATLDHHIPYMWATNYFAYGEPLPTKKDLKDSWADRAKTESEILTRAETLIDYLGVDTSTDATRDEDKGMRESAFDAFCAARASGKLFAAPAWSICSDEGLRAGFLTGLLTYSYGRRAVMTPDNRSGLGSLVPPVPSAGLDSRGTGVNWAQPWPAVAKLLLGAS